LCQDQLHKTQFKATIWTKVFCNNEFESAGEVVEVIEFECLLARQENRCVCLQVNEESLVSKNEVQL